jgi:hypothetical protein
MFVLTALWAARDARVRDMRRFERVFPLDPLALGLAIVIGWPVSFPWYWRLRRKAKRGALAVRTRPSRLRFVVLGLSMLAGLAAALLPLGLRRLGMTQETTMALMAIMRETDDRVMVRQANDTVLAITVGLRDSLPVAASVLEAEGRLLATVAAEALPPETTCRVITLTYVPDVGLVPTAVPASAPRFAWHILELRPGVELPAR